MFTGTKGHTNFNGTSEWHFFNSDIDAYPDIIGVIVIRRQDGSKHAMVHYANGVTKVSHDKFFTDLI